MPVATHCPYCALQCGMTVTATTAGGAKVDARDFPTNRGGLCRKGWTSADLLTGPGRLTTPLARRGKRGPLLPVSWDEALDLAAAGLSAAQARGGANAVA